MPALGVCVGGGEARGVPESPPGEHAGAGTEVELRGCGMRQELGCHWLGLAWVQVPLPASGTGWCLSGVSYPGVRPESL